MNTGLRHDPAEKAPALKRLLHVGSGTRRLRDLPAYFQTGWEEVRYDLNPEVQPDVVGDMLDLSALEPESFDAVWASHVLEHVYPHEAQIAIQQIAWRLKPDGFLIAACPDLRTVCAFAAERGVTATAYQSPLGPVTPFDMLFGFQRSIREGKTMMAHRGGFDLVSLKAAFTDGGLPDLYGEVHGFHLYMVGCHAKRSLEDMRALLHALTGKD